MIDRQQLIEAYQPLAYKLGNRMWWKYLHLQRVMDREDCIAEAVFSLVKAADKFVQIHEDGKFGNYVYRSIENHFIDLCKKRSIDDFCEVTFTEIDSHAKNEETSSVEQLFVEDDEMLEMVELLEELSCFIQTCNEKEKALLRMVSQGYSQKECAFLLVEQRVMKSCTQPAISDMLKKLVQRFRKEVLSTAACGG